MIRLVYNNIDQAADFNCSNETGTDVSRPIETAILLSLFCDARAGVTQVRDGEDRRGWWADSFADNDTWGSRLWMIESMKQDKATLRFAREEADRALQWMIADGVARSLEIETWWLDGRLGYLGILVRVFAPQDPAPQLAGPWEVYYAVD